MDCILELQDVSVMIQKKCILQHITLPILNHSITAVIGMSGCGKTTLLRTLNRSIEGKQVQISGNILLQGQSVFSLQPQEIRKRIGLIFQKPTPFPFSIFKNMTYALNYYGIPKNKQQEIVAACLRQAGLYDEIADRMNMDARLLSGGQQQRLCIARALAVNPQVLLLDEPCSSLDIKNMLHIEQTLQHIKSKCTIIIVTHNLSQARRIADNVVYMENGQIIESGTTSHVFDHPQHEKTKAYLQFIQ